MTVTNFFKWVGETTFLSKQVIKGSTSKPFYVGLLLEQIYMIGIRSFPLVAIVALSTGMVMALQFGAGLEKFGGKPYVPKIVSLSIVRELGPVFTCLLLAARVGAGITAEIGAMKVSQQIDAMRALGTSPIRRVVVPRVLASIISFPLLGGISNVLGILGATVIGMNELGLDPFFFAQKVSATIYTSDIMGGLAKTVFFSIFVSVPACLFGLKAKGGTEGVGIATTQSVVTGSILIVIGDVILTKAFWIIEKWF